MDKKCRCCDNLATHTKPLGFGQVDIPLCDDHRDAIITISFGPGSFFANMRATVYPSREAFDAQWGKEDPHAAEPT